MDRSPKWRGDGAGTAFEGAGGGAADVGRTVATGVMTATSASMHGWLRLVRRIGGPQDTGDEVPVLRLLMLLLLPLSLVGAKTRRPAAPLPAQKSTPPFAACEHAATGHACEFATAGSTLSTSKHGVAALPETVATVASTTIGTAAALAAGLRMRGVKCPSLACSASAMLASETGIAALRAAAFADVDSGAPPCSDSFRMHCSAPVVERATAGGDTGPSPDAAAATTAAGDALRPALSRVKGLAAAAVASAGDADSVVCAPASSWPRRRGAYARRSTPSKPIRPTRSRQSARLHRSQDNPCGLGTSPTGDGNARIAPTLKGEPKVPAACVRLRATGHGNSELHSNSCAAGGLADTDDACAMALAHSNDAGCGDASHAVRNDAEARQDCECEPGRQHTGGTSDRELSSMHPSDAAARTKIVAVSKTGQCPPHRPLTSNTRSRRPHGRPPTSNPVSGADWLSSGWKVVRRRRPVAIWGSKVSDRPGSEVGGLPEVDDRWPPQVASKSVAAPGSSVGGRLGSAVRRPLGGFRLH